MKSQSWRRWKTASLKVFHLSTRLETSLILKNTRMKNSNVQSIRVLLMLLLSMLMRLQLKCVMLTSMKSLEYWTTRMVYLCLYLFFNHMYWKLLQISSLKTIRLTSTKNAICSRLEYKKLKILKVMLRNNS